MPRMTVGLLGCSRLFFRRAVVVIAQRDHIGAGLDSLNKERDGKVAAIERGEERRGIELLADVVEEPSKETRSAYSLQGERKPASAPPAKPKTHLIQLPGAMMPTNSVSGDKI